MSFFELILRNVTVKPVRSALTALAVSIGVAAGITIGITTHSLRQTAIQILEIGQADFSISQEGMSDILSSVVDEDEVDAIGRVEGVESIIGVLVAPIDLDDENPFFLRIGIEPESMEEFGIRVVEGRAFTATAPDEVMLGYRAARNLEKEVGDEITMGLHTQTIVGLFATDQPFGDSAAMMPLVTLQGQQRTPGDVTLAFVRVTPGVDADEVRFEIEDEFPQLVTVRTVEEFGRADRNLALLTAADDAATIVALIFGVIIVTNTMLLAFTERIREFGVLRALGWSRRRIMALVISETMVISLAGAAIGVALSFVAVRLLGHLDSLSGVLEPQYTSGIFGRALLTAAGIGFLGAIYPALRAAFLAPLEALRRE